MPDLQTITPSESGQQNQSQDFIQAGQVQTLPVQQKKGPEYYFDQAAEFAKVCSSEYL